MTVFLGVVCNKASLRTALNKVVGVLLTDVEPCCSHLGIKITRIKAAVGKITGKEFVQFAGKTS